LTRLYVRASGEVVGPFDVEEVRRCGRLGKLTPTNEASVDGQNMMVIQDSDESGSVAAPAA
jgi:hypothetical protein